jgi:hypothetical protein
MFNPETAPRGGIYHLPAAELAAQSLAIKPIAAPVHDDGEIERVISSLGREPGGGLVPLPDGYMVVHRASIISAAARNNVPAVYNALFFVRDGGLLATAPTSRTSFGARHPMSIVFYVAQSRLTCQFSCQSNL